MSKIVTKEYFDVRIEAFKKENKSLNEDFTFFNVLDVKELDNELREFTDDDSPAHAITQRNLFLKIHTIALDSEKFINKVSESTLEFVLYHELGHIKCQHYKNKNKTYFEKEVEADMYAIDHLNMTPVSLIKVFHNLAKTNRWSMKVFTYLELIPRIYFLNKKYKESKNS